MEKFLSCPECGGEPNLISLEPEYHSMKYLCGVHASCGDWKSTEEIARIDWNRRVKEYKDMKIAIETPFTPEWIYAQGVTLVRAYCERCDYETDVMPMKNLAFKLNMEGGYIISDKSGGYFSQCPKCESSELSYES